MSSNKHIFWFEEIGQEHNDIVGKKCANLGEMMRITPNIPLGFAVSTFMYRRFIEETGAAQEMASYVKGFGELKGKGIEIFTEMSQTIQGIIERKKIPAYLKEEIITHYEELCNRVGIPDVPVSVRSAGTESRPGMFDTYLNVKGVEEVLEKIKRVWASAYTARAIAFRVNKNIPVLGDEMGVGVVKMVNARSAGIGFTVNPITGDTSKVVIEANWGLGEGVVSGAESVDRFVVDKKSLDIVERIVVKKTKCVVNKEKGVEWIDVPPDKRSLPSSNDEELIEVAKLAKQLEERMGCPQDMEWAIDSDFPFPQNVFLLQTRPAKTVAKKQESTTDRIIDMIAKKLYHRL